ncbi:MAG TPA: insulinase family protein [Gammaproteobacteria bacterium]
MRSLCRLPSTRMLPVVALLLLLATPVGAQTGPASDVARTALLDRELPTTSMLTVGTLDNGLRYFIRENDEPENRAFLRLVVNAGSVLEEDDELGAAHFLEHMAFNGTEHFEKQELVEFMESIGMPVGRGLNAGTSFDETVYMLTVPTDVPEHMETAFEILEDWSHALTLDPDEIEQERSVVLEEWRSGQGAGSRVRDLHFPILLRGSRYAQRLPIGTPESIRSMDRDTLLGFYRKWYRPDLLGIIAVGDFDADRIEALIRQHFEDLPAASPEAPERVAYDVPSHTETLFSVAADPEVGTASVQVFHKMAPDTDWTIGGYRRRLVEELYNDLLNLRLLEIAREPDAPFLQASSETTQPIRATGAYTLSAVVPEDGIERGLRALLVESERVEHFGFTESELERGKTALLREMERRYARRDDRPSRAFAGRYTEAFLTGRPVPGIEYEKALHERFVPGITLEEVNAVGRRWLDDSSRVVLVTAPEKDGLELPDEAALAAVLREAEEAEVERYVDTSAGAELLAEPPAGSSIVDERTRPGGLTEWELGNGVLVVLKPTDFDDDEVVFRGILPGGLSLASDEDLIAARTAVPVIMAGGLGELDANALQRVLTGKAVRVDPVITDSEVGVSGRASVQDLETMFKLIYLRFTAPRADERAFAAVQNQLRLVLANRDNDPAVALNDAFTRLMTRNHPRARPMTAEMVDRMSLERSLAFYRDRFADASGATFVFVGAFDLDTIRPLVERYIGGLPAAGKAEAWRDHGLRWPEGVVEETVRKGLEPRSQTRIAFHGDLEGPRERTMVGALAAFLQTHLFEVLREELGGTYGVSVRPVYRWVPAEGYMMTIEFSSDPERANELTAAIFAEIEELKRAGPPADKVADTREAMLRRHETRLRQNDWWLTALSGSYQHEPEPGAATLLAFPEWIEALTPEAIRDGLERYLDPERYVRVTLVPEESDARSLSE